jgi:integrase
MARHIRYTRLESRTARAKLEPRAKPYFFGLGGRLALGYRKGKNARPWLARIYTGDERYAFEPLGESDDLIDADGVGVLDFRQAQAAAHEALKAFEAEERTVALGPAVSIGDVVKVYGDERFERGFRDGSRLGLHVLKADPALARMPLAALTAKDLKRWRGRLSETMVESSTRRISNDFRAALNAGVEMHRAQLPPTIRDEIRYGLAGAKTGSTASERKPQVLPDADIRRLVDAAKAIDEKHGWGGDLYAMTLTLAATGARFSQVQRLRVGDLQVKEERLMTPTSRKGSSKSKPAYTGIPIGPDVVGVLGKAAAGRRGTDILLLRPRRHRVAGPGLGKFEVYERGPWKAACELTRSWRLIVERADLPPHVVPYAFRHSSIVRCLSAGMPSRLVAGLHDTSSLMIEQNYGAHIVDALEAFARRAVIPLAPTPVTPLHVVEG